MVKILGYFLLTLSCIPLPCALATPIQPPLKIGIVLPLTGPIAWVGAAMQRGVVLASEQEKSLKVELFIQDDLSSDRMSALSAFKLLTSSTKVDAILNCSTSTISAIAPVIDKSGTPTVVIWDSNREMAKLSPQLIGFGYSNEQAAEEAAEFIIQKRDKKRVGVISYTNDWSELLAKSFVSHLGTIGGSVTINESVDGNSTDFRALILRAKIAKSDALYLPLYGAGLIAAIKQARELKFPGEIITVDSLGDDELHDLGAAAEGIFVSQIILEDKEFAGKLKVRFPEASASVVNVGYSALAADALNFIVSGYKASQSGAQSLSGALKGREFSGALGATKISSDGLSDRSIPIVVVRHGGFRRF